MTVGLLHSLFGRVLKMEVLGRCRKRFFCQDDDDSDHTTNNSKLSKNVVKRVAPQTTGFLQQAGNSSLCFLMQEGAKAYTFAINQARRR